jgi:hypothetical protein
MICPKCGGDTFIMVSDAVLKCECVRTGHMSLLVIPLNNKGLDICTFTMANSTSQKTTYLS